MAGDRGRKEKVRGMNGDGREFIELKQEFKDYKDRQIEANTDIKARLSSIDASLSALAPIIIKHEERFGSVEFKCVQIEKSISSVGKRTDRIEMGVVGTLVTVAGLFLSGIWSHIFPPKG